MRRYASADLTRRREPQRPKTSRRQQRTRSHSTDALRTSRRERSDSEKSHDKLLHVDRSTLGVRVNWHEKIAFDAAKKKESSVRVVARFRPPLTPEERSMPRAFEVQPDRRRIHTINTSRESGSSSPGHVFELDHVFDEDCTQEQVYDAVGHSTIEDVLVGYNGTIFAYGQTGSGKTHTMMGPSQSTYRKDEKGRHGVIPRTAQHIFDRIHSGADDVEFVLRCSLFEVYREQVRDLLNPTNQNLRVKERPQRGLYVDGLSQEFVSCERDIMTIIHVGERMRAQAATLLNQHSSRSHVIFSLLCEQRMPDGTEKIGKLNLVDLAGSEKVWKSSSWGVTLEEAKKINWSLAALGNVISALSEKRKHVPYRDSKLTRILQETLGGNFKTALIATCSSSQEHYEETLSSLYFASRAKAVCNHVKMNFIYSADQLMSLVEQLQNEIIHVKRQNAKYVEYLQGNVSRPITPRIPPSIPCPGSARSSSDTKSPDGSISPRCPSSLGSDQIVADSEEFWRSFSQSAEAMVETLSKALVCQEELAKKATRLLQKFEAADHSQQSASLGQNPEYLWHQLTFEYRCAQQMLQSWQVQQQLHSAQQRVRQVEWNLDRARDYQKGLCAFIKRTEEQEHPPDVDRNCGSLGMSKLAPSMRSPLRGTPDPAEVGARRYSRSPTEKEQLKSSDSSRKSPAEQSTPTGEVAHSSGVMGHTGAPMSARSSQSSNLERDGGTGCARIAVSQDGSDTRVASPQESSSTCKSARISDKHDRVAKLHQEIEMLTLDIERERKLGQLRLDEQQAAFQGWIGQTVASVENVEKQQRESQGTKRRLQELLERRKAMLATQKDRTDMLKSRACSARQRRCCYEMLLKRMTSQETPQAEMFTEAEKDFTEFEEIVEVLLKQRNSSLLKAKPAFGKAEDRPPLRELPVEKPPSTPPAQKQPCNGCGVNGSPLPRPIGQVRLMSM